MQFNTKLPPSSLMQVLIARAVVMGALPWPDSRSERQRKAQALAWARSKANAALQGTVTGRMSSDQPNFEELPREDTPA